MAIISLVSGIASWFVLPLIGAIIAVVTGHMAKKEIRESAGRLSGVELANAGLVLGYVHLAVSVVTVCIIMIVIAVILALAVGTIQWSNAYIRIIP
jgi:phosphate/sulfate permease